MPLSQHAIHVLTSRLPEDKIKLRPGKGGMQFSYISADYVIETLNRAFDYQWSTKIVSSNLYDNVAVVGLELTVPTEDGSWVSKQQFGSGEAKGMDVGDAFKSAASDALKKCATLLGLGLELYQDEAPTGPSAPARFVPPTARPAATPPAPRPVAAPKPMAAPAPAPAPTRPAGPPPPRALAAAVPAAAAAVAVAPPKPQVNPFLDTKAANAGPTSIQINSMTRIAEKKGLDAAGLIALAEVTDKFGHPVRNFEELTRDQAIAVIQAAQR